VNNNSRKILKTLKIKKKKLAKRAILKILKFKIKNLRILKKVKMRFAVKMMNYQMIIVMIFLILHLASISLLIPRFEYSFNCFNLLLNLCFSITTKEVLVHSKGVPKRSLSFIRKLSRTRILRKRRSRWPIMALNGRSPHLCYLLKIIVKSFLKLKRERK